MANNEQQEIFHISFKSSHFVIESGQAGTGHLRKTVIEGELTNDGRQFEMTNENWQMTYGECSGVCCPLFAVCCPLF